MVGQRDRGGSNLRKLEGGGENFDFPGAPEIDPSLQRFYRKSPIWGPKVQVFEGQLSGRFPPPSNVRYVLTPPIPVSDMGVPKQAQMATKYGKLQQDQNWSHNRDSPQIGQNKNFVSGPKKPWQPQTWQNSARFSPPKKPAGQFCPHFGAISLLNYTVNLEKREKTSTRENSKKSSGDGAPKLQISVPCRGRTCLIMGISSPPKKLVPPYPADILPPPVPLRPPASSSEPPPPLLVMGINPPPPGHLLRRLPSPAPEQRKIQRSERSTKKMTTKQGKTSEG